MRGFDSRSGLTRASKLLCSRRESKGAGICSVSEHAEPGPRAPANEGELATRGRFPLGPQIRYSKEAGRDGGIGVRSRLKICSFERCLWVRLPLPALKRGCHNACVSGTERSPRASVSLTLGINTNSVFMWESKAGAMFPLCFFWF